MDSRLHAPAVCGAPEKLSDRIARGCSPRSKAASTESSLLRANTAERRFRYFPPVLPLLLLLAVVPPTARAQQSVVLGNATAPLMSPPYAPTKLVLLTHRVYKSGSISMTYELNSCSQLKRQVAAFSSCIRARLQSWHPDQNGQGFSPGFSKPEPAHSSLRRLGCPPFPSASG